MSICDICESDEIIRCEHCEDKGKMKDYLCKFKEDVLIIINYPAIFGSFKDDTLRHVIIKHVPTGLCYDSGLITSIFTDEILLKIAANVLEEKIMDHYEKERVMNKCKCTLCHAWQHKDSFSFPDIIQIVRDVKAGNPVSECIARLLQVKKEVERQEESKSFSKWLKDNVDSTAELSRMKKDKKPLHPGKVANDLLVIKGYACNYDNKMASITQCDYLLKMNGAFLAEFFGGRVNLDYMTAYKLAKAIEGTDVRFWLDLQERYDSYDEERVNGN